MLGKWGLLYLFGGIQLSFFLAILLLSVTLVSAEDKSPPKVISNTATATFMTTEGSTVIVESAPGGNSVPGEGKGTPLNITVKDPKDLKR